MPHQLFFSCKFQHATLSSQVLFRPGDPPDAVYVIESGSALCHIDYSVTSLVGRRLAAAADKDHENLKRQPRCA